MIIDDQDYDLIIVGTGAGGGTLAHKLAATGKKILILERGDFMTLAEQNRSDVDVFKRDRYHAPEQWYDNAGEPFSPQMNYAVGGNTKIYNAALLRLRERDFEQVKHQAGISPAWCLQYADFAPYYTEAEALYQVHGQSSNDPTEPSHSSEYPFPAIEHQAQVQAVVTAIEKQGLHPTSIPLSLTPPAEDPTGDAEIYGISPALKYPNVTSRQGQKWFVYTPILRGGR
jgi:choline dehydrogenase-like flavoprotein